MIIVASNVGGAGPGTDVYWSRTVFMLKALPTAGATNNFILDSSYTPMPVSKAASVSHGLASPFGGWSGYIPDTTTGVQWPATGTSSAFTLGTGDFTVEFWYKLTSWNTATGNSYLMGRDNEWRLQFYQDKVYFYFGTTAAYGVSPGWEPGRWYHLAISRYSGLVTIWVDGVQIAVQNAVGDVSTTGVFSFGCYSGGSGAAGLSVSNLRVVKGTALYRPATPPTTALTAVAGTSLLTCQSSSTVTDASSYGATVTRYGDAAGNASTPFSSGGSVRFDGTGDYMTVPGGTHLNLSGDFTIEFWLYNSSTTNYGNIFGTTADYGTANSLRISTGPNNNTLQVATAGTIIMNASATFSNTTWTHVVLVRYGSLMVLFQNGVCVGTASNSTSFISDTFYIGNVTGSGGPYPINADIADFRVVKGRALYPATFTPPTSPLTAVPGTSLLTFQRHTALDDGPWSHTSGLQTSATSFPQSVRDSPFEVLPAPSELNLPAWPSNWSAYFDGSGDLLYPTAGTAATNFSTGDFTVEFWYYALADGQQNCVDNIGNSAVSLYRDASGYMNYYVGANQISSSTALTSGKWWHVALVRSSGTSKLYINGVKEGVDYSDTNSFAGGANYPMIGAAYTGSYNVNGYMSNLRIVKSAVYTAAFTPPTAKLTAISGTSLLALQDSTFKDNSSNNLTFTVAGNPVPVAGDPFSTGSATLPAGYWSGYFDGSGDYLTVPSNTAWSFGTGAFCVELWINPQSWPSSQYAPLLRTVGGTNGFALFNNGGNLVYHIPNVGDVLSASLPQTGMWSHIALCRSGTTVSLFVNGTRVATGTNSTNQSNADIAIGGSTDWNTYVNAFISNVRVVKGSSVYDPTATSLTVPTAPLTAISGTALLALQDSTFKDNSSNAFTITKYGDAHPATLSPYMTSRDPAGYWAGYVSGTGSYLQVEDNAALRMGTGDFTIEFWYRPASISGYQTPLYKGYNTGGDFVFQTGSGDGRMGFVTGGAVILTSSTAFRVQAWNHYAVVRSGTTLKMYQNGVQVASATNSTNFSSTVAVVVSEPASYPAPGFLSNLRMVKGVAVYDTSQTTITVPTSPLTAVSGTSLLTLQDNTFSDRSGNAFPVYRGGSIRPMRWNPFGYDYDGDTEVPNVQDDPAGSAYFAGTTGSYVTIPPRPGLAFGTGDFTIEFWVYPMVAASAASQIWFASPGGSYRSGIAVGMRSGVMWWQLGDGSSWIFERNTGAGTAAQVNAWSHIAVTRSAGTAKLFVNGQLIDSVANTTNLGQSTSWQLGEYASAYNLTGYVSNLRIIKGEDVYRVAFTPPAAPVPAVPGTVLLLNFDGPFGPYDATRSADMLTPGDAKVSTAVSKYNGASVALDGTGDYVQSPAQYIWDGGTPFTAECWIYPTRVSGTGVYEGILTTRAAGVVSPFNLMQDGSTIRWLVSNSAGNGWTQATGGTLTANTWHHLAICGDGTNIRVFLNGAVLVTMAHPTTWVFGRMPFIVGGNLPEDQYFNGYIEDARLTMGVARYQGPFNPPSAALPTASPVPAAPPKPTLMSGTAVVRNGGENSDAWTLPAHQPGDIIIVVMESYSTVAGTLAAPPSAGGTVPTWTRITKTASNTGALYYAVATASNHTSGTWTSSPGYANLHSHTFVVRGGSAVGGASLSDSTNGGSSWAVSCPAATLADSSGTSLVIHGSLGADYVNSNILTVVSENATGGSSGYTSRGIAAVSWLYGSLTVKDESTSAPAYTWGTVTGSAAAGHAYTIEIVR